MTDTFEKNVFNRLEESVLLLQNDKATEKKVHNRYFILFYCYIIHVFVLLLFEKQQVPRLTELLEEEIVLKKLDQNTEQAENQSKSGGRPSSRFNWNYLFKVKTRNK